jgi:NhaA family Na+:H+ antiporter
MQIYALAVVCGVGFTMSLFIGELAFVDPAMTESAKLGVLAGSLASGLVGWALLRYSAPALVKRAKESHE